MRLIHGFLIGLALLGCGGKDKDDDTTDATSPDGDADTDTDTDTDTDADTDVDCTALIEEIDPVDDAVLIRLDTEVTVTFDEAIDPAASWSIDVVGAAGAATLATDGMSATWTPTADLDPETVYTIDAAVCDDTLTTTFRTLPPPVDPTLAEGNTYALSWDTISLSEPGNPALLETLLPIDFVLLQLATIDPVTEAVDAVVTLAWDDGAGNAVPDCDVVVQEEADFDLNPYISYGPGLLQFVIDPAAGTVSDLEDFTLLARVSADGTALTDVRISALVAPEQYIAGETCTGGALISLLQPTCVPCTVSSSGSCMLVQGAAPFAAVQPAVDILATCGL